MGNIKDGDIAFLLHFQDSKATQIFIAMVVKCLYVGQKLFTVN